MLFARAARSCSVVLLAAAMAAPPCMRLCHDRDCSGAVSVEAAHVEGLDLEIFLDAGLCALAAEAGLLDAAERRDLHRDQAGVQADHAEFERLADAPGALEAFGIEIGGQPE